MDVWSKLMPTFSYDPEQPFFEILVPTVDTVRFGYVMQKLIQVNKPVLFTGGTGIWKHFLSRQIIYALERHIHIITKISIIPGVGKSVIAKMVLNALENTGDWLPIVLNFSAQTSSGRTQEILELKLERKRKTALGAPVGKRVCMFVDDVNMPKLDTYGSQPPIELLRHVDVAGDEIIY